MATHDRSLVSRSLELMVKCIDAPLSVPELAQAVGASESALKRAFAEIVGDSPAALSRRLRLELAFRTLRSREQSILDVALASGYDDHAAFSRAFRRAFGFAPHGARQVIHVQRELASLALAEPDFVELQPLQLQAAIRQGSYFVCAAAAWAALAEALATLPEAQREHALYVGRALDDPHAAQGPAPDAVRFAAAVAGIDQDLGLERTTTRGGTYARFRYSGKLASIGLAYHYIYGAWRDAAAEGGHTPASEPALVLLDSFPAAAEQRVIIAVPVVLI